MGSHSKDPIDIMKDGAKIGEMTGGEYIFNFRQATPCSLWRQRAARAGTEKPPKEFDKR